MKSSIKKLDQETINKIAAGEVIVRPSAALKELIENSIDAGSTEIDITIEKGGMRKLQISDNGHGIHIEDYPILCERFTTSKIAKFKDLTGVTSFGFRGEALASISFVSRVEITSKVKDQPAYVANFQDSKLLENEGIVETEREVGTTINVQNMFHNNEARRKEFKVKQEFINIIDIVSKYSIYYPHISFSLYDINDSEPNLFISTKDVAQKVLFNRIEGQKELLMANFGSICSKSLLECSFKSTRNSFDFFGLLVAPTDCKIAKKSQLILFINNRLVQNSTIKKCIETLYNCYLEKGQRYLAYIELYFDGKYIDVNVHPTKKEVSFLEESEVGQEIEIFLKKQFREWVKCNRIQKEAEKENKSALDCLKEMPTQYKISQILNTQRVIKRSKNLIGSVKNLKDSKLSGFYNCAKTKKKKKKQNAEGYIYYKHNVRVTNKDATLEKFERKPSPQHVVQDPNLKVPDLDTFLQTGDLNQDAKPDEIMEGDVNLTQNQIKAKKDLLEEIEKDTEESTASMCKSWVFIGMIDPSILCVQYQTLCLIVKTVPLLQEYLYQEAVNQMYKCRKYKLTPPIKLKVLLYAALCHPEAKYTPLKHIKSKRIVENAIKKLQKHGEYLNEMFGIEIVEDELRSLPKITPHIPAYLDYLPILVLKLATDVTYISTASLSSTKYIAKTVGSLLAEYYSKFIFYYQFGPKDGESTISSRNTVTYQLEHVIFPELIKKVKLSKRFMSKKNYYLETLTTLGNLYRIFERCSG